MNQWNYSLASILAGGAIVLAGAAPASAMCALPRKIGGDLSVTYEYLINNSGFFGFVTRVPDIQKGNSLRQRLMVLRSFRGPGDGALLLAPYSEDGVGIVGSSPPTVDLKIGESGLVALTLRASGFYSSECLNLALSRVRRPAFEEYALTAKTFERVKPPS